MNRFTTLLCAAAFAAGCLLVAATCIRGQSDSSEKQDQIEGLQDILEKGLKARRPEEFAFLQRVVQMVQRDELPLSLVMSTFTWARKKQPYQMPYFQKALIQRAAEQGIKVS
jgi:hypothetical protein